MKLSRDQVFYGKVAGAGAALLLALWKLPSATARVTKSIFIDDDVNSPTFGMELTPAEAAARDAHAEVQRLIDVSNAAIDANGGRP